MSRPKVTPLKPKTKAPGAAATMSPEEAAELLGMTPPALPAVPASELKGALLTQERIVIYTHKQECENKKAGKEPYTIYRRGPVVVGVFAESSIIDDEISGLVTESTPPAPLQSQG